MSIMHIVALLVLGAGWYLVDQKWGIRWYRLYYNFTRKEPLADNEDMGFLHHRKAQDRVKCIAVIVVLQTLLIAILWGLLSAIIWIAPQFIFMTIGMYLMVFIRGQWQRSAGIFEVLDKIESGDEETKQCVETVGRTLWHRITSFYRRLLRLCRLEKFSQALHRQWSSTAYDASPLSDSSPSVSTPTSAVPSARPEPTLEERAMTREGAQELIDQYRNRQR